MQQLSAGTSIGTDRHRAPTALAGLDAAAGKRPDGIRRDLGGNGSEDIFKAFTNALFETHRNLANSTVKVLNIANVDAPGVVISPRRDLVGIGCPFTEAIEMFIWVSLR